MSCQLFSVYFLFVFFVCCQLCDKRCGARNLPVQSNVDGNSIPDFLKLIGGEVEYEFDFAGASKQGGNKIAAKNIGPVFLAANKDFLVALAEVSSNGTPNKEKINIFAKFLKIKRNLSEEAFENSGSGWKTQLVTQTPTELKSESKIKSSTVVVNGDKIYYFLVTGTTNGVVSKAATADLQLHVAVIDGKKNRDSLPNEALKWTLEPPKLNKVGELNKKVKITLDKVPPVVSFGFAIENKIVFAIQGEGNEGDNKDTNVTVFFKLGDNGQNLEFLYVEPTGKCFCSLFLWKGQIVMVPSVCTNSDGNQQIRLFEYKDTKVSKVSEKQVSFLQEFFKNKEKFFTTKNDQTEVLLFTQQIKETEETGTPKKHSVYLWVADGQRAANVGTIITEDKDSFDLSMLHADNELFVLHKKKAGASGAGDEVKYDLKRLPELLTKIKSILEVWGNTNNNKIKNLFDETATTGTSSFTNGLVGFLAGDNKNDGYWKDEFFYENATLTPTGGKEKPTKVSGGFKFNGVGAGAKWPVGKSKENQPYNFAKSGFTLVATVEIDTDASKEKKNSILGVGLEGSDTQKRGIELWCDNGKWSVESKKSREEAKSTAKQCVPGGIYHVALLLQNDNFSVYIGKNKIKEISVATIEATQPLNITHFYFGVENDAGVHSDTSAESHVTVTNVLLYKRPFNSGEIGKLKEAVEPAEVAKPPGDNTKTTPKGDQQTSSSPTDPIGEEKKEKAPSPSRTEDGGVGGGVRVFSLLLAVLCVSAPLLHL